MSTTSQPNNKLPSPHKIPMRSVKLEAFIVERAEEHARAKGLTVERYIANGLRIQLGEDPLPEEQRQIDEFLAKPGRRAWLDAWRQKLAIDRPPTMADIAAAHKAEDREARYEYLKETNRA